MDGSDINIQKVFSTALHKNKKNEKHKFYFKETEVSNMLNTYQKLFMKEMIHIKKEQHSGNNKQNRENPNFSSDNILFVITVQLYQCQLNIFGMFNIEYVSIIICFGMSTDLIFTAVNVLYITHCK